MRLAREARSRPALVKDMGWLLTSDPLSLPASHRRVVADTLAAVGTLDAQAALAQALVDDVMLSVAGTDEYVALLVATYHVRSPQRILFNAVVQALPRLAGRARDQALMTIGALGAAAAKQAAQVEVEEGEEGEEEELLSIQDEALMVLEEATDATFAADAFDEDRRRLLSAAARSHWSALGTQERMSWLHSAHGWRHLEGAEMWDAGSTVERDGWVNKTVWAIAHELDASGGAPDYHMHGRVLMQHHAVAAAEAAGITALHRLPHDATLSHAALEQHVIVGNDVVRALSAFGNLRHPSTVSRLLRFASSHSNSVVRVAATSALRGFVGHTTVERHLVESFRDETAPHSVRLEAIETLTAWETVTVPTVMRVLGVFVDNLDVDWERCAVTCADECIHRTKQLCNTFCANRCGSRAGHEAVAARFLSRHMDVTFEDSGNGTHKRGPCMTTTPQTHRLASPRLSSRRHAPTCGAPWHTLRR